MKDPLDVSRSAERCVAGQPWLCDKPGNRSYPREDDCFGSWFQGLLVYRGERAGLSAGLVLRFSQLSEDQDAESLGWNWGRLVTIKCVSLVDCHHRYTHHPVTKRFHSLPEQHHHPGPTVHTQGPEGNILHSAVAYANVCGEYGKKEHSCARAR